MAVVERFLEASDVARRAGLGVDVIQYHAERGALRVAARTVRGCRLFRVRDVDRWLRQRGKKKATGGA